MLRDEDGRRLGCATDSCEVWLKRDEDTENTVDRTSDVSSRKVDGDRKSKEVRGSARARTPPIHTIDHTPYLALPLHAHKHAQDGYTFNHAACCMLLHPRCWGTAEGGAGSDACKSTIGKRKLCWRPRLDDGLMKHGSRTANRVQTRSHHRMGKRAVTLPGNVTRLLDVHSSVRCSISSCSQKKSVIPDRSQGT